MVEDLITKVANDFLNRSKPIQQEQPTYINNLINIEERDLIRQ